MGNANEKFLVLLKLLNNCRQKYHSLYELSYSTLQTSKEIKAELGRLHDEIMSIYDELKLIERSGKYSKLIVKNIKTKLEDSRNGYALKYEEFKSLFDECVLLYKQYKQEVQMCCDTYNKMKNGQDSTPVEKGYRQQVTVTQAIKRNTKKFISKHNDWVEAETKRKDSVDNLYNNAQIIISSL